MCVHFASATWDDIARRLDQWAIGSGGEYWHYPDSDDYLVLLYEYADHATELEPEVFGRLCDLLGRRPASALCLELRRSKGRAAHDAATGLARGFLREFKGVVEGISGSVYWSLADLESGAAGRDADRWWPHD